jgi:hypothetical protein
MERGTCATPRVISRLFAKWTFVEVSIDANEAAARILAAVVQFRFETRYEVDFGLQLGQGWEVT